MSVALKTLEVGAPFRLYGHRYVVVEEADVNGRVEVTDELGNPNTFPDADVLVERSE